MFCQSFHHLHLERDNDFIRPDIHPCSVCHASLNGSHVVGDENFDKTYNDMLQGCQRHRHTRNYCINSFDKCRSNFQRPLQEKSRVVVKDHPCKLGKTKACHAKLHVMIDGLIATVL
jgi:hypothetical protein